MLFFVLLFLGSYSLFKWSIQILSDSHLCCEKWLYLYNLHTVMEIQDISITVEISCASSESVSAFFSLSYF